MEIKIVCTEADFDSLQNDWTRLIKINSAHSVFQSWEWQRTWWKYYGINHALRIIVAYQDNQVVAILPLYIQSNKLMRILNVNVMRFLGVGGDTSPDYLGLIGLQDQNEEVLNLIVDVILDMKKEWDSLNFTSMETRTVFITKLINKCSKVSYPTKLSVDSNILYVKLKTTWDEYLLDLSSNRRSQIRRSRRKFEKLPGSKFYIWENGKDLSTAIDHLAKLHLKRWKGRSDSYSFSSSEYLMFHHEVVQLLFPKDLIRLCCLELDGNIIAMLYCYKWNGRYYYFQSGIDPDYGHLKPGSVLMGYAIEQAIIEGQDVFDMLKGDYDFKRSLAKQENITWLLTVYKNSLLGKLMRLRLEVLPRLKVQLKNIILKRSKYLINIKSAS